MKKLLFLALMLGLSGISFSYEDYYEKVYVVKVSKNDIYKEINATPRQQKRLNKILEKYQKEADKVDGRTVKFDEKKAKIGKIEEERYLEISKILSPEQLQKFSNYVNGQKTEFNEKNDKIKKLVDSLDLTNEQKNEVLKAKREFERNINKLKNQNLSDNEFSEKYYELRKIRNEEIDKVLTPEQREMLK
jgi:hypothetical protein